MRKKYFTKEAKAIAVGLARDKTQAKYRAIWGQEDAYNVGPKEKECRGCLRLLPKIFFWKNSTVRDGIHERCKDCDRKAQKTSVLARPERTLWRGAKQRAKQKGLPFTIQVTDIIIPSYCPVLGIKLIPGKEKLHANSPTLDQIQPNEGYTPDNVRVISHRANTLKSNATLDELRLVVNDLERYQ